MPSFKEIFPNKHVVLPVIHVETKDQTLKNTEIAQESGADGVFLISMSGMNHQDLSEMHRIVKKEFPFFWIGVNYLDLPAVEIFKHLDNKINGIWADNAHISELLEEQVKAKLICQARDGSGWQGLHFGGVAFKYQKEVHDFEKVAKIAKHYMSVVTTSGTQTGSAPDLRKIEIMKEAIGDKSLAIASGISPENVKNYKKIADCFLVATSLLKPGTEDFDKTKIKQLVDTVRGF